MCHVTLPVLQLCYTYADILDGFNTLLHLTELLQNGGGVQNYKRVIRTEDVKDNLVKITKILFTFAIYCSY